MKHVEKHMDQEQDAESLHVNPVSDMESHRLGSWAKLHQAAHAGELAEVERLVLMGENVNARDEKGRTPLFAALDRKIRLDDPLFREILEERTQAGSGEYYSGEPLPNAKVKIVRSLIDAGADVNSKDDLLQTPIYWAIAGSHIEVVRQLLKAGADINVRDWFGNTPLHVALQTMKNAEILEMLIRGGANVACFNNNGETPVRMLLEIVGRAEFADEVRIGGANALSLVKTQQREIAETLRRIIASEKNPRVRSALKAATNRLEEK